MLSIEHDAERIARWGDHLAEVLLSGGRVFVAGDSGSVAHALHAETAPVAEHGRQGDLLLVLSPGDAGPGVVEAARAARRLGIRVWALTGPPPNQLHDICHENVAVRLGSPAIVEEIHLTLIHMLSTAVDLAVKHRQMPRAG